MIEKLDMSTPNFTNENIAQVATIFPNCVSEIKDDNGKVKLAIDFDLLKQELSTSIVEGIKERYRIEWPGKKEALAESNKPINKTLRAKTNESVRFDSTKNLYIEGDNLEALKLLQDSYLNSIKMIYIDPPYNTGNDFIYKDNFVSEACEELEASGQTDYYGNKLLKNQESNGRYHSDWLSMLYARLKLSRNLLKENGVIFIAIDDNEVHNLRKLCDEIFGENNFLAHINRIASKGSKNDSKYFVPDNDYILVYCKNKEQVTIEKLLKENTQRYPLIDNIGEYKLRGLEMGGGGADLLVDRPNMGYSIYYNSEINDVVIKHDYDLSTKEVYKEPDSALVSKGYICIRPSLVKGKFGRWRWSADNLLNNLTEVYFDIDKKRAYTKDRKKDFLELAPNCNIECLNTKGTIELGNLFDNKIFDFPKPVDLLKQLIKYLDLNGEIILDFFSGSATTAHAVMQLNAEDAGNRRFIMVQLPEVNDEKSEAYKAGYKNICEIGKERIRRAGIKILEDNKDKEGIENLDIGFRVFKVDSSNMKDVYYNPDEIRQDNLFDMVSNIKEDRTDLDLLFQVLLDSGVELTLPIEEKQIVGKKVYFVDGNVLAACFEDNLTEEFVTELAKCEDLLKVVFRDSSFGSDDSRINVEQIFKQYSPDTQIRVI